MTRIPTFFMPILCLLLPIVAGAQLDPYTSTDREERQNILLQIERQELEENPTYDSVYKPYGVLLALLCELEAQERDLVHPDGEDGFVPDDVEASQLLAGAIAAIRAEIGLVLEPNPPEWDGENVHSVIDAAMFAAYILHRFPNAAPDDDQGSGWSTTAWNTSKLLLKYGNWPYKPALDPSALDNVLSNNPGGAIAMQLLAGEAFDDEDLIQRARWSYAHARATLARRGLAGEPLAPYYTGRVITQLAFAWHTEDPTLRQWIQDLLEMQLIAAAHSYLPGGAAGAPQQRDRGAGGGGGIADPSPTETGTGLLQQVNLLIFDEELDAKLDPSDRDTYPQPMLATDYHAPEIIRSLFLDKGPDGYAYKNRTAAAWDSRSGCCDERTYRSTGWQGWNPDDYRGTRGQDPQSDPDGSTNLQMQPGYGYMLPGGLGSIGGYYASAGAQAPSWAAYVKDPAASSGFSILYQHQPSDEKYDYCEGASPPFDPLSHDPRWVYERKNHYRRMSWDRTQMTLYDTTPEPTENQDLDYALAHLPLFMQQCSQIVSGGDSNWWVGQPTDDGNGPYAFMAYRPLGQWSDSYEDGGTPACGDAPADAYTLITLTDPISGYIAEVAPPGDYTDSAAYCGELATRTVSFGNASVSMSKIYHDLRAQGEAIRLKWDGEERVFIKDNHFDALSDTEAFGTGVIESPFVTWSDEPEFTLTLARDLDDDGNTTDEGETRVLEFGDPSQPAPPWALQLKSRVALTDPIELEWDHSWNDTPNDHYEVIRNGTQIATVSATATLEYTDNDLCTDAHVQSSVTDIAKYWVRAVRSTDTSLESYRRGTLVHGDVTPPSTPGSVSAQATGPGQITVSWAPATDNWHVDHYRVTRTDPQQNEAIFDDIESSLFIDGGLPANTTYEYKVVAVDGCLREGISSITVQATTPAP